MTVDVTRHLRIAAWLHLGIGAVAALVGGAIVAFTMVESEAGLLLLIAAPILAGAAALLAGGYGMLGGLKWGLVVALVSAVIVLPVSVIGIPVSIYTFFVAYLVWREGATGARHEDAAPEEDDPWDEGPGASLRYPAKPRSLAAHFKILGSLYVVVSLFPLILGVMMLVEWQDEIAERGPANPEGIVAIGALLTGLVVAAAAHGLFRQRRWAVLLSLVVAVPLLFEYPHGTIVAGYAAWVAYQAYQASQVA
jgi:hypothetical protein